MTGSEIATHSAFCAKATEARNVINPQANVQRPTPRIEAMKPPACEGDGDAKPAANTTAGRPGCGNEKARGANSAGQVIGLGPEMIWSVYCPPTSTRTYFTSVRPFSFSICVIVPLYFWALKKSWSSSVRSLKTALSLH